MSLRQRALVDIILRHVSHFLHYFTAALYASLPDLILFPEQRRQQTLTNKDYMNLYFKVGIELYMSHS